ncbi:MAG: hypothetical protein Q9161_002831 [Pseudevernia consocians]
MVWQSRVIAPSMNVKWKPVYGLNWTSVSLPTLSTTIHSDRPSRAQEVPVPGLTVALGGKWRQCDQGQVLDLGPKGAWVQSTATATIGYLKVGKNNYQTNTGTNGVHFLVGVQEASGGFSPIFLDPSETGYGMSALYQPQEKVQWWFQAGMQTSTIISHNIGPTETGDFTEPDADSGTNSKTSTYNFKAGKWTTTSP